MKLRIRPVLIVVCLGLSGPSVATADADETGLAVVAESGAADIANPERDEDGKAAPAQAEEHGRYGIFSSIFNFFRGRKASARPKPALDVEETNITPSHVYQATMDLIAEIEILRKATNVVVVPLEAELREDKTPVHAYAKSLEVMEKTARVQRRLGMIPAEVGRIPAKDITAKDVYRMVRAIIDELGRVKRQLVVEDEIRPAPFAGGKTPSLVYKHLADASYLLDGMIGRATTSNDVYMRVLQVHDEMELIAAKLGIALQIDPPPVDARKEPKDVAQQILRATYKVVNLQSRLGMDASNVPNSSLLQVTPAEAYDATNHLLAEVARIKVHLNIESQRMEQRESRNKQPADVFAQVLLLIRNLDVLTKSADGAG